MDADIIRAAQDLKDRTVARRRDFHKHAEAAWTEFRTASIVAKALHGLGYRVLAGEEVIDPQGMMGLPSAPEMEQHFQRALAQGADPAWAEKMRGGRTGVVGVMTFGRPTSGRCVRGPRRITSPSFMALTVSTCMDRPIPSPPTGRAT